MKQRWLDLVFMEFALVIVCRRRKRLHVEWKIQAKQNVSMSQVLRLCARTASSRSIGKKSPMGLTPYLLLDQKNWLTSGVQLASQYTWKELAQTPSVFIMDLHQVCYLI